MIYFLPSKYFTGLVHAKICIILLITEFTYTKVQIYLNHFSTQVYHCGESYEVQTNVRYIHV